jgi:hypothetical protein
MVQQQSGHDLEHTSVPDHGVPPKQAPAYVTRPSAALLFAGLPSPPAALSPGGLCHTPRCSAACQACHTPLCRIACRVHRTTCASVLCYPCAMWHVGTLSVVDGFNSPRSTAVGLPWIEWGTMMSGWLANGGLTYPLESQVIQMRWIKSESPPNRSQSRPVPSAAFRICGWAQGLLGRWLTPTAPFTEGLMLNKSRVGQEWPIMYVWHLSK